MTSRRLKTADGGVLNSERVPRALHALAPWLSKFSIERDTQRVARLHAASRDELKRLVEAVSPYYDTIDTWFDSFKSDQPDEAWAYMRLAQAADHAEGLLIPQPTASETAAAERDAADALAQVDQLIERLDKTEGDSF